MSMKITATLTDVRPMGFERAVPIGLGGEYADAVQYHPRYLLTYEYGARTYLLPWTERRGKGFLSGISKAIRADILRRRHVDDSVWRGLELPIEIEVEP
jgi:hypothetical protein